MARIRLLSFGCLAAAVLIAGCSGEEEQSKGADSVQALLQGFASAVDEGKGEDAVSYIDTSNSYGTMYASYIKQIADLKADYGKVLSEVEQKYGSQTRGTVEAILTKKPSIYLLSYRAMLSEAGTSLKSGSDVNLPGFTNAAKVVEEGGKWRIDPEPMLKDVPRMTLETDLMDRRKLYADIRKLFGECKTAPEFLSHLRILVVEPTSARPPS